jgi:hypothetical protein
MPVMPAGRTSSVKAQGKTFIIQTEFRPDPGPVIISAVTLDGQTVHKVERAYDSPFDTETGFLAAEAAIVAQHENLAKKIRENAADFIKKTRSIQISRIDRLGIIPGVSYIADIDEKLSGDSPAPVYAQSRVVLEIADAISQSSRVGPFQIAAIVSDQGKFILNRDDGKGYLLSLKHDADIGQVMKEAREI